MEPYGKATFQYVAGRIFRTETKIYFGTSRKNLGLVIMLNPGSASLSDGSQRKLLENGSMPVLTGRIELDDTMNAVVDILTESHPNLDGVLHIHNLFTLRNSDGEDAIRFYVSLYGDNRFSSVLHTDFQKMKIKEFFPWVWIGWTVNDRKVLRERKREVIRLLPENIKIFAIFSGKEDKELMRQIHTKHPWPRIPDDQKRYKEEMVRIMREYWSNKVDESIETIRR